MCVCVFSVFYSTENKLIDIMYVKTFGSLTLRVVVDFSQSFDTRLTLNTRLNIHTGSGAYIYIVYWYHIKLITITANLLALASRFSFYGNNTQFNMLTMGCQFLVRLACVYECTFRFCFCICLIFEGPDIQQPV